MTPSVRSSVPPYVSRASQTGAKPPRKGAEPPPGFGEIEEAPEHHT
jgi:hypothetical protein